MSKVHYILKFKKNASPYNILTCSTHERYEESLAKTGHNFYAIRVPGMVKDWNTTYAKIPSNYGLLDYTRKPIPDTSDLLTNLLCQLPPGITFDFVLSQNKFGQFQILSKLADHLRLPLISLEHTLPMPNWNKARMQDLRGMEGEINVFISEYSRDKWGWNPDNAEVIHHCVNSDLFKPMGARTNYALSVCNDWVNRYQPCGFRVWEAMVKKGNLPVRVLGDTPGLSKPAPSTEALAEEYAAARIFLNTSLISPVPTALLEAMSAGCAVVTTNTCMIPEIVKHGVNGYLFDPADIDGGIALVKELLDNPELADKLGTAARETIVRDFSIEKNLSKWNSVFDQAANMVTL